jgi:hypothetical protein
MAQVRPECAEGLCERPKRHRNASGQAPFDSRIRQCIREI